MDQSWCPVCDRAIEPKRVLVAAASTAKLDTRIASRTGHLGLVHGTGRVKPGGQLKPVENAPAARRNNGGPAGMQNDSPSLPPAPPSSPTVRTTPANRPRVRAVISDDPTPLYCSDACRDEDASRLAQCLSPLSALSSSRCSSSPEDDFDLEFFSGSESASSPGETLGGTAKQALKLTGFTPVRPRSPPHKSNPDSTRFGTMEGHRKFEEAASRRKPMPPPRSPAAFEEHPFDPRMPPGWRPHEHGQWRKVLYGDFSSSQRQRPTRQNSTPTSPSAAEHSHSSTSLADATPVPRTHRNSLPALNDMTVLYNRYDSDMSARRASRELHATGTLLERTPSSSTFTSLSSRSNSITSISESTPATTADSDSDDMSKGFALGGGARTYSTLSRIGSASSLDALAPPPVPTRSDSLAKLADRDRERERRKHATSTEAAQALATVARTLPRRVASANDVQAQQRDAERKLAMGARTRTVKRVVLDQVNGVSEEREVEQTVMRRPLFTFASARA